MTVRVSKNYFAYCDECKWFEGGFGKKAAKRRAASHDCVKYLRRHWSLNDRHLLELFEITVERKSPAGGEPAA